MKLITKKIATQLGCSEERALEVYDIMEDWFDPDFSEMTNGELRQLISEAASFVVPAGFNRNEEEN